MGDFYKEMKLIIFKDTFLVTSDNRIWANYLETNPRFSNALGLTKENKSELREISRDELIRKLKNEL
jgi:hypothetical protein